MFGQCSNCGSLLDETSIIGKLLVLSSVADQLRKGNSSLDVGFDVHARIRELQSRIRSRKNQMNHLRSILDVLSADEDLAQDEVKKYRSLLSPIRRLPEEILLRIFQFLPRGKNPRDTSRSPWILGQICSYWRFISVNCPLLWTVLKADERHVEHFSFQPAVEMFLKRSAALPLHIVVKANGIRNRTNSDRYAVFLQELCRHSHRWRTIILPIPTPVLFEQLRIVQGRLPILHHLALNIVALHDPPRRTSFSTDAFIHAPQLERVRLDMDVPGNISLPMSQLTVFDICQVSWKDLHGMLTRGSNLTTLRVVCYPPRTTPTLPIISHSRLQTLIIDGDLRFLSYVQLPKLTTLEILPPLHNDISEAVISLIERSDCPLSSLLLRNSIPIISIPCLLSMAKSMAALQHLAFEVDRFSGNYIFSELADAAVLPSLRQMDIFSSDGGALLPNGSLQKLILARRSIATPVLQSFRLRVAPSVTISSFLGNFAGLLCDLQEYSCEMGIGIMVHVGDEPILDLPCS
ncbi:uncharacterized protein EV420DRAFT_1650426 [Desarmillaria tabescens]|uniref:F-box domain-containing protein n=1 Tax=Armillaria tabescens TaxID=1929756 RepID=A0AA39JDA8_ARMTA|nr:uncharacterized protein EV420DRAFT_1650426 [Desarmillaria tabescens]KAK0440677.1 hypothetical protein EV420DRAFT_1650426 [Desarmillaria tabescens]